MQHFIIFLSLIMLSCSAEHQVIRQEGALKLNVRVIDTLGQSSTLEEAVKKELTATIFNENDQPIRSWADLNNVPAEISLATGNYYVVVSSKDTAPAEENAITHYAKTALLHIRENQQENISLSFEDHIAPPDFSGFTLD